MNLASLDLMESFALLGPGFGDGRFLLLQGLRDVGESPAPGDDGPLMVFAPFETTGREARVLRPACCRPVEPRFVPRPPDPDPAFDEAGIREAVARIREAIAAGDVYQVCHTLRAPIADIPGSALLSAMCGREIPRFAAWVRLPGGPEFVSASPELFFEIREHRIHSQPMKGTAPPGSRAALECSTKDRCELAMITDLVRNDLTPICRPQSVRVRCDRRILDLPYALQAVSDVDGELLGDVGPLKALDALHPGGSVTGAPKAAALALIGRLERTPRGPYCGALGFWKGAASTFSLLIRTATRTGAGWAYGVGSGIVWDSDADREIEEFRTKLGALGCATRCCD